MLMAVPAIIGAYLHTNQTAAVSLLSFVVIAAGGVGCMIGGLLVRRLGGARVASALLLVSGVCCLLAPWMLQAPWWLFAIWMLVWGFSVSADSPQFSALTANNCPPAVVGSVLTLVNAIGFTKTIGGRAGFLFPFLLAFLFSCSQFLFPQVPERKEEFVYSIVPFQGDEYAGTFCREGSDTIYLLAGHDDSIEVMASRLGVRRDYLTVLVRLSYLSPEIVRAVLLGQQPVELSPTRLVKISKDLPHDWHAQRQVLGFSTA